MQFVIWIDTLGRWDDERHLQLVPCIDLHEKTLIFSWLFFFVLLGYDVKRGEGFTEEELKAAKEKAAKIYEFLHLQEK